jgi:TusA-related sulfurtransferase
MKCGEPRVPGGNTVFPLRLKMIEKGEHVVSPEVLNIEIDNPAAVARCEKTQKQNECIAVAQQRSRTQPSREWQMLTEKHAQGRG